MVTSADRRFKSGAANLGAAAPKIGRSADSCVPEPRL